MRKDNIVSLWIANFENEEEFDNYLQTDYENDKYKPSNFQKDFNIKYFDEDFFETDFYQNAKKNWFELLEGFSYDDTLIEKFSDINKFKFLPSNAVILVYNFDYNKNVNISNNQKVRYIGSVPYK